MSKFFDRNFIIFAIFLCGAILAFLMQDSPQYAPFSVESSTISAPQNTQKYGQGGGKIAFTTLPNSAKSAHSSSIMDLGDKLMLVYFAGSREGASDVAIMQHFINKDSLESTQGHPILDAKMLSKMTGKFIKKLGNPVIFSDKNKRLHLFVVGVSLGGWATAKIYQLEFRPDLESLEFRGELHLGLLANFSHLVRTPPIALENGGFMLPIYHELARKYALVAFFDENANYTHALHINRLKNQLQPTIIALDSRKCLAFFRNHKAYNNASFLQKCDDFGRIWEQPKATNLNGYDDSALLVSYQNAQNVPRILLIYNDGRRQKDGTFKDSGGTRNSLGLYVLGNKSHFSFLQNIDSVEDKYPNEVSYPSAVLGGEWLFVAYTHNRKNIKIARINLSQLEAQIAQDSRHANSPRER